ncbi:MAG: YgiT-type zinc finger protein [Candidatus Woesearchaeota archaeon]
MKRTKCEECGGRIVRKKVDYEFYGTLVGKFPAEVCNKCGEICFDEDVSREITEKTKELGLWGLETRTKIGAAGSTLDVRLSKKIIEFMGLKKGEEVVIYPQDRNRLIVELPIIRDKRRKK